MINYEAFFKISYGLYIVSSGDRDKSNAFISNTVFQVTAEPPQFAASCNKNNHTAGLIEATGAFSVSVLHQEAAPTLIGNLGYKSGRDSSKMEGLDIIYGETGVPIVFNDSIAWLECKVVQTIDVGTHLVFIGEVVNSELINVEKEQITYDYYRKTRKAVSPKNAPTYVDKSKLKKAEPPKQTAKKYLCPACGYVYDPEKGDPESGIPPGTKFEDLPDSWVCPVCGTEKMDFVEQ